MFAKKDLFLAKDFHLPLSLEDLVYQDFDREKLLKNAFEDGKINGYSEARIESDLLRLAFLASFKSDCYNAIYKSRSDEEKKWLLEVKKTYNLRIRPCKIPNGLTLRRLAVAYARELSLLLHEEVILPCIDPDTLAPGFPAAMCVSSFACLIPTHLSSNEFEILKQAFCYFRLAYDKYAYPKPQERFTKQQIKSYVEKRTRIHPYKIKEKEEHLLKVGIIVKKEDKCMINPDIKPALEEASRKWEAL